MSQVKSSARTDLYCIINYIDNYTIANEKIILHKIYFNLNKKLIFKEIIIAYKYYTETTIIILRKLIL